MDKTEYDDIIDNLRDNLELLSYAGITGIPAVPAGRPSQVPGQPSPSSNRIKTEAPVEWTYIENPEPAFSAASLTGPDKKALAFGMWHSGTRLCFISGETLTGKEAEPFSGPVRNQMALLINWIAGELRLSTFDSMSRYLCFASGPSEAKETDGAYPDCGGRLRKEMEKNRVTIVALLGRDACGALLGSTDVSRLRGRFHRSGDLLIMPTWGPDDLLKDAELKKQTKADMLMVIAEAGKTG